jgi:hypothetical protein
MPDDLIHCPACHFQLRLPPELYGSGVECPQCRTRFTAPVPVVRPAGVRPPPGREYDAGPPAAPYDDYAPPTANPVAAPAIALLIVSVLGLLFDGYMITGVKAIKAQPKLWEDRIDDELDKNPDYTPEQRKQMKEMLSIENVDYYGTRGCGTLLAGNLLTTLAAVLMLTRRGYAFAVIGCLLALDPVNFPTCFLQVPFGIWGLVALFSESGRRAFR